MKKKKKKKEIKYIEKIFRHEKCICVVRFVLGDIALMRARCSKDATLYFWSSQKERRCLITLKVLNIGTGRSEQTLQTYIRLLLHLMPSTSFGHIFAL